jgi:hypothetical protein
VGRPTEEDTMGFMDKAKKLAEQAQEKVEEAQQQFNERQGGTAQPGGEGTRFDEHGRPVSDAPPAGSTPPPPAEPVPEASEPGEKPREGGGAQNATPDPFKPIE